MTTTQPPARIPIVLGELMGHNNGGIPFAIMALRAYLEARRELASRIHVTTLRFCPGENPAQRYEELRRLKPVIAGFSCYLWSLKASLSLSALLKTHLPGVKTVLGGPEATPRADELLREHQEIDFIVRGEGEETFAELCRRIIDGGNDFGDIAGLSFRKGSEVAHNPDRTPMRTMDALPFPYPEGFDFERDDLIPIETQRGCPYSCGFCYDKHGSQSVRYRDLQKVKDDLGLMLQHKARSIFILDSTFNSNPARAREILQFIAEHNAHNTDLYVTARMDLLDEDTARLFKAARLRMVEIGIQSADNLVLANINRSLNRKGFVRGCSLLKKQGITIIIDLILGLPGETLDSFWEGFTWAMDLEPFKVLLFPLQVLPGSDLWRRSSELGLVFEPQAPYAIIQTATLSREELTELRWLAKNFAQLKQDPVSAILMRELDWTFRELARAWYSFLEFLNVPRFKSPDSPYRPLLLLSFLSWLRNTSPRQMTGARYHRLQASLPQTPHQPRETTL